MARGRADLKALEDLAGEGQGGVSVTQAQGDALHVHVHLLHLGEVSRNQIPSKRESNSTVTRGRWRPGPPLGGSAGPRAG